MKTKGTPCRQAAEDAAPSCMISALKSSGLACLVCGLSATTWAQTDSLSVQLDAITISTDKFPTDRHKSIQKLVTLDQKDIEWAMPANTADLIEKTGSVFIQRSQGGGGSAQIRGFEASRVLLVIDGVRMNNAIYRSGHLQNLITVSPRMLEKVDILYGPSSTLYGSDALGGVIHMQSRKPRFQEEQAEEGEMRKSGAVTVQFGSAHKEKTIHGELELAGKRWASLTAVQYSDYGDLRQGKHQNPFYDSIWHRQAYVQEINGEDQIIINPDPLIQKYSGYTQFDLLQKLLYRPRENLTHSLNLQYSTSSEIPRYDRLTEWRQGQPRFARWYYGPQQRFLAAYSLESTPRMGFFQEIRAGFNYQRIQESRMQRAFRSPILEHRIEDLDVLGYYLDGQKRIGLHVLHLGIDGQYNAVRSHAYGQHIQTHLRQDLDTRYPDGGSRQFAAALYAQHQYPLIKNKLFLRDGLRLNYVDLYARFLDKSFFPFPFDEAKQQSWAWSGSLGLRYTPMHELAVNLYASTGFRAPNVDDLGKVFESAGGMYLIVPNPQIDPEYTYNLDLGLEVKPRSWLKLGVNGFHTWLRDIIVVDAFRWGNQDSLLYQGVQTAIFANQNKARGYIYGGSAALEARLHPEVVLESMIQYQKGRYMQDQGQYLPLDHISPVFGQTSLSWEKNRWQAVLYVRYQGWKRLHEYSPSGEDNLKYATPLGTPAWHTLNLRLGYQIHTSVSAQIALENIGDQNYRSFSSGISGPGRNLLLTLSGRL